MHNSLGIRPRSRCRVRRPLENDVEFFSIASFKGSYQPYFFFYHRYDFGIKLKKTDC